MITLGERMAGVMRRAGARPDVVVCVPNWIDGESLRAARELREERDRLPSAPPYAVACDTITHDTIPRDRNPLDFCTRRHSTIFDSRVRGSLNSIKDQKDLTPDQLKVLRSVVE